MDLILFIIGAGLIAGLYFWKKRRTPPPGGGTGRSGPPTHLE